jgi:hypothetical protein
MPDRRSHRRFQVRGRCEGILRLLQAVPKIGVHEKSIVLVGDTPAVVGERLVLDVLGPGAQASLPVDVQSSRPIVIDGAVRHEIRVALAVPEASGDTGQS